MARNNFALSLNSSPNSLHRRGTLITFSQCSPFAMREKGVGGDEGFKRKIICLY
jgi:hypothetical protein